MYFFRFHARFSLLFFFFFFRVRLLVDDDPDTKSFDFLRSQTFIQPIRFGGDDFEGCISNVFIERYLAWWTFSFIHFCLLFLF